MVGYLGEPVLHCTDVKELGEDGPLSDHDGNDDLSDSGDGMSVRQADHAKSNADGQPNFGRRICDC